MGENSWGIGIILATPHADWKERHKIATDTGKNTIGFIRKHPLVKLKLAEEVYGICQKDIFHLCMHIVYWSKFLSTSCFTFGFCSVFFKEKLWKREIGNSSCFHALHSPSGLPEFKWALVAQSLNCCIDQIIPREMARFRKKKKTVLFWLYFPIRKLNRLRNQVK